MGKLEWVKHILQAPLDKLLLIVGSIFVLLAFNPLSYSNKQWQFQLSAKPNCWLLGIGLAILAVMVVQLCRPRTPRLSSTNSLRNGFQLKISPQLTIEVVTGEIQSADVDFVHGAFVLPANTAFDDECIRDERSALGAFFQTHFPNGISEIQSLIRQKASEAAGTSSDALNETPPGTTIFLDRPLGSQYRILVTAVTRFDPEEGISADTLSLIASVKSVFKKSAGRRLSELCLPVLGTGHGGLDFAAALSLMLVQSVHCVMHEGAHHIRHVKIVVYDPNGERQKDVHRVIRSLAQIIGR